MSSSPSLIELSLLAAAFVAYSFFAWLFLRVLIRFDGWLAKGSDFKPPTPEAKDVTEHEESEGDRP